MASAGAETTGGKLFSAEGMHNYSIEGLQLTLDTNYSTAGMVINTQDTNYFSGEMLISLDYHFDEVNSVLLHKTLMTPSEGW